MNSYKNAAGEQVTLSDLNGYALEILDLSVGVHKAMVQARLESGSDAADAWETLALSGVEALNRLALNILPDAEEARRGYAGPQEEEAQ